MLARSRPAPVPLVIHWLCFVGGTPESPPAPGGGGTLVKPSGGAGEYGGREAGRSLHRIPPGRSVARFYFGEAAHRAQHGGLCGTPSSRYYII